MSPQTDPLGFIATHAPDLPDRQRATVPAALCRRSAYLAVE